MTDQHAQPDLRGSDAYSPQRLLDLVARITEDGWHPQMLEEAQRAGCDVVVSGESPVNPIGVSDRLFTVTVHVTGRRIETVVDSDVSAAIARGIRYAVCAPPVREGTPLRP